ALLGFEQHDRQFRIDGPSRPDDIRIQLPRIPSHRAVLHEEAAVEAYGFLAAFSKGYARRRQLRAGELDAFGDFARQLRAVALGSFEIAAVRAGACAAIGDERPGVAVGRADHDVRARDASGAVDHLARFLDHRGRYADQVARYQCGPLLARRDHDRL